MRDYVGTAEGRAAKGLRVTIVRGVPSPWGEAVKGLLHVKGVDWLPVSFDVQDEAPAAWTGEVSAPVAMFDDEAPKSGAVEIMQLFERVAPDPALVPEAQAHQVVQMAEQLLDQRGAGVVASVAAGAFWPD